MNEEIFDIAVVGGGINGCGIARDAAGRGLSVVLLEKEDLASATSSASTKLVHGGLRYLEHYEFRLVRESLREREVLLNAAPHIIWPMRFVLPHNASMRPAWLIRLGLFLYDHIGGRERLPGCRSVELHSTSLGEVLRPGFRRGFEYSDCWVDDARLVVLSALDAAEHGADIRVATEFEAARRDGDHWRLTLRDTVDGGQSTIRARSLVNAAGPWVADVAKRHADCAASAPVRLVKGSHIVVPKLFEHDRAYIFQNADRRIVFAIPYERDFTLIGTTDVDLSGPPEEGGFRASQDEIEYLCTAVGEYFKRPPSPDEVVWSYAGVRPLYDTGDATAQTATRDYVFEIDGEPDDPPLLNVIGGKITTYRELAEEALRRLSPWFPTLGQPWTRGSALPGGDFPVEDFDALIRRLCDDHPFLDAEHAYRLARAYGTRAARLLDGARSESDLGRHFGATLYEREVRYLIDTEWARTAEDILWRRSKLGLRMSPEEADVLSDWIDASGVTAANEQADH